MNNFITQLELILLQRFYLTLAMQSINHQWFSGRNNHHETITRCILEAVAFVTLECFVFLAIASSRRASRYKHPRHYHHHRYKWCTLEWWQRCRIAHFFRCQVVHFSPCDLLPHRRPLCQSRKYSGSAIQPYAFHPHRNCTRLHRVIPKYHAFYSFN